MSHRLAELNESANSRTLADQLLYFLKEANVSRTFNAESAVPFYVGFLIAINAANY